MAAHLERLRSAECATCLASVLECRGTIKNTCSRFVDIVLSADTIAGDRLHKQPGPALVNAHVAFGRVLEWMRTALLIRTCWA
jgi:hypothetical protein